MCVLSSWQKINMVMPLKPVQLGYWVDYKSEKREWTQNKSMATDARLQKYRKMAECLSVQFRFVLHIRKLQDTYFVPKHKEN